MLSATAAAASDTVTVIDDDVVLEPETVTKNRNDEKVEDQNGQSNEEKQISETKTDESLSRERNDSIAEPMDTSDTAPVETNEPTTTDASLQPQEIQIQRIQSSDSGTSAPSSGDTSTNIIMVCDDIDDDNNSVVPIMQCDSDDITAKPHERDENINQSESHSNEIIDKDLCESVGSVPIMEMSGSDIAEDEVNEKKNGSSLGM